MYSKGSHAEAPGYSPSSCFRFSVFVLEKCEDKISCTRKFLSAYHSAVFFRLHNNIDWGLGLSPKKNTADYFNNLS